LKSGDKRKTTHQHFFLTKDYLTTGWGSGAMETEQVYRVPNTASGTDCAFIVDLSG